MSTLETAQESHFLRHQTMEALRIGQFLTCWWGYSASTLHYCTWSSQFWATLLPYLQLCQSEAKNPMLLNTGRKPLLYESITEGQERRWQIRQKIYEHSSLKLQRKERKGCCQSSPLQHVRKLVCCIKCVCDTENVEMQLLIGIFNFCLNISSYI